MKSPVGPITLVVGEEGELKQILFAKDSPPKGTQRSDGCAAEAARQLAAYFDGNLKEFDLVLQPEGTEFQRLVWNELLRIPYGETRSYAQVAASIGKPSATRAVGAANGANPIPIVVPCHRVIGASGQLVGYGGGLDIKARLLELEGLMSPALF